MIWKSKLHAYLSRKYKTETQAGFECSDSDVLYYLDTWLAKSNFKETASKWPYAGILVCDNLAESIINQRKENRKKVEQKKLF